MDIYFYDENMRYIGHRKLEDGEKIPSNSTLEIAVVLDKQEAYLVNSKWVINDIIESVI